MFNGRRQPSRGGTSRMTRECQVRFCERLEVKFPGPTRHPKTIGHARQLYPSATEVFAERPCRGAAGAAALHSITEMRSEGKKPVCLKCRAAATPAAPWLNQDSHKIDAISGSPKTKSNSVTM
jgi:hypothetical protein